MPEHVSAAATRVGLVGCGGIGRTHASVILGQPELSLAALVDPVAEARSAVADSVSRRAAPAQYGSLTEALADDAADLFVLATPSSLHIPGALEVLEAGKHVIIEKPLDVDLVRAQEIEAAALAAEARGQLVTVISQHRFDPGSLAIADTIAAGGFGRLCSAIASVSWWRSQPYYDSAGWRGTWAMDGGGALMNQGVHTVDLLLWFLGRPVSITGHVALLAHRDIEVEDTAAAVITFESGALAVLHATTSAYPGLSASVQLMGSRGSARIDNDRLVYFHVAGEDAPELRMGINGEGDQSAEVLSRYPGEVPGVTDPTAFEAGHARQYRDVVRALAGGDKPRVRVSHAVNALACVRAVYLSSALRRTILFDDLLAGVYAGADVASGVAHASAGRARI